MKKLILTLSIMAIMSLGFAQNKNNYCFIDYGTSNCGAGETKMEFCYSLNGDGSAPYRCGNLGCYAESEYSNYDSCCIE